MKSQKQVVVLTVIACLIVASFLSAEEISSPLQLYQIDRDERNARGRLLYARETLRKTGREEVVREAVLDLVKYSSNEDDSRTALQLIDAALQRIPDDSDGFRESTLAKGKILARLGEKEAAKELFVKAIQNRWKNAVWRYSESFIDNGDLDEACLLEFERIAGLRPYRFYRGDEESLEIFLTLLRMMKHADPNQSAMESVYNCIRGVRKNDPFLGIAKALCMAVDGNAAKAAALLNRVEATLSKAMRHTPKSVKRILLYKNHREHRHVPLYLASILHKDGKFLAARNAFDKFIVRNEGKNAKIAESAIRLTRDMDIEQGDQKMKDEFCRYLLESDWFQNPNVLKDIGEENIAVLYDQYQNGLAWSEQWDRSADICKMVIEKYPDTLGGQHCLQSYALYIGWHDKEEAESVKVFNRILENPKSDTIAANIRVILAERAMKKNERDEALYHIDDALNRISPYEKGWKPEFRNRIQNLRKQILSMFP